MLHVAVRIHYALVSGWAITSVPSLGNRYGNMAAWELDIVTSQTTLRLRLNTTALCDFSCAVGQLTVDRSAAVSGVCWESSDLS